MITTQLLDLYTAKLPSVAVVPEPFSLAAMIDQHRETMRSGVVQRTPQVELRTSIERTVAALYKADPASRTAEATRFLIEQLEHEGYSHAFDAIAEALGVEYLQSDGPNKEVIRSALLRQVHRPCAACADALGKGLALDPHDTVVVDALSYVALDKGECRNQNIYAAEALAHAYRSNPTPTVDGGRPIEDSLIKIAREQRYYVSVCRPVIDAIGDAFLAATGADEERLRRILFSLAGEEVQRHINFCTGPELVLMTIGAKARQCASAKGPDASFIRRFLKDESHANRLLIRARAALEAASAPTGS